MTKIHRLFSTFALCAALTALPAVGAEYQIQEVGGEVSWATPNIVGTSHLVVIGPSGFQVERTFSSHETPYISLFDGLTEAMDGSYRWSLTVATEINGELLAEIKNARAIGDRDYVQQLKARGHLQSESYGGHFLMLDGRLILPELSVEEEMPAAEALTSALPTKAQVFTEDVIMQRSACVGVGCSSTENFGYDTLRMVENNLRIHFNDNSSVGGSFPSRDWRLVANDTTSGGDEYFAIEDDNANTNPLKIVAGARDHSVVLASNGFVGFGTATPVLNLHVKDGDTPTLRLDQDGSSGYPTYTWDVGGNETNFFVRAGVSGGQLPFRIQSGALQNSLYIATDKEIGIGTANPAASLHVFNSDGDTQILVDEDNTTVAQRVLLKLENNGIPSFQLEDTSTSEKWAFSVKSNSFEISKGGSGAQELVLDGSGNLTITGSLTTNAGSYADYVFRDDYELASLDEVEDFIQANGHLPNVKSEEDVEYGRKVDLSELSVKLLEKVEELTLYTIEQHKQLRAQEALNQELMARLAALEAGQP